MKKIPVDIIMFDLDGTLTDSIPAAVNAVQDMLKELKYPYKSPAEINQSVGFGEIALVAGSIGSNDPEKVKIARESYYRNYVAEKIKHTTAYPHANEVLDYFRDKILVIISNKKDDFIHIILRNLKLSSYFKHVYGGDASPCLKPDPCVLLKILREYSIPPNRALFVGDMTIDVETGKNAGVHTCAVAYGFDGRKKVSASSPDFIIDDLLELKSLIE